MRGPFKRTAKAAAVTIFGATSAGSALVPETMQLTPLMKNFDWTRANVVPIDFTVGVKELSELTAKSAIQENTGTAGSIAFVVRRPG